MTCNATQLSSKDYCDDSICLDGNDVSGDTTSDFTWMMVSTLLVLTMMPALALFEAGLLRTKNSLMIITQIFVGLSVLSFMWYAVGFSLVFGPSQSGVIGNLKYYFLVDVSIDSSGPHLQQRIPHILYALFQSMFAAITPLLITGSFAERTRFKASFWFIVFWEVLVYYPVAHWVWNRKGFLNVMGVHDFAGGLVVHWVTGVSSIVCAVVIGPRSRFRAQALKDKPVGSPSSLPLATIGLALLWAGWFGFNGGSAFGANKVAITAVVNTQISASCSVAVWLIWSWYKHRPSVASVLNGAIAGLAGVTPASGFITPPAAVVLGILLGLSSFKLASILRTRIDDSLEGSVVHGFTGMFGTLFVGVAGKAFKYKEVSCLIQLDPQMSSLIDHGHGGKLLGFQFLAVVITGAWAAACTRFILWVLFKLKYCFGDVQMNVKEQEEGGDRVDMEGLAYNDLIFLATGPGLVPEQYNAPDVSYGGSASSQADEAGIPLLEPEPGRQAARRSYVPGF